VDTIPPGCGFFHVLEPDAQRSVQLRPVDAARGVALTVVVDGGIIVEYDGKANCSVNMTSSLTRSV
jgi:hypothetical protein